MLRSYTDHELDHSDEDTHDRSVWTDADVLDAICMACEIIALFTALYYTSLDDNPEKTVFYHGVSVVALVISVVPLALSVKMAVSDGMSDEEGIKVENPVNNISDDKSEVDEVDTEAENPLATE